MFRSLLVVISAIAFAAIAMLAAYLDRGYSPVMCAFWGGILGCGVGLLADMRR